RKASVGQKHMISTSLAVAHTGRVRKRPQDYGPPPAGSTCRGSPRRIKRLSTPRQAGPSHPAGGLFIRLLHLWPQLRDWSDQRATPTADRADSFGKMREKNQPASDFSRTGGCAGVGC